MKTIYLALTLVGFGVSGIPAQIARTNGSPPVAAKPEVPAGPASLAASNGPAFINLGLSASSVARQEIRLLADGAVADYGLQKVLFPAEITEAPLTIITPDGRKLACRATFLALHDVASGQSLLLGEVRKSIGLLTGENSIVYPDALDTIHADIRFRYTPYSLEQDLLLYEQIQLPKEFQATNVQLEVWSEWIDSTPDAKEVKTIDLRPLAASGKQTAVAATDERLKFGAMQISDGYAFGIQSEGDKTPVAKTFARIDGHDWLIERVDYTALKPQLDKLPKSHASLSPDNLKSDRSQLVRSMHASATPKPPGNSNKPMRMAKAKPSSKDSVVLDFVIVSSVPVPAGVISWWPAGNTNDAITTNHGTWVGTAAYSAGKVGQGFALDGASNAVTVASAAAMNFGATQDFTMETWIKPLTNTNPSGIMSIIGKRHPAGIGYELFLMQGQLGFQIGDPVHGILNVSVAGDLRADGQYHHVAVTVVRNDPAGGKLYVDGVANYFDATAISGVLSNTQPFRIGLHPDSYYGFFKGIIDEPAIYARALGASEIQAIYNAGAAGKNNPNCLVAPTNIVAWWPGDGNVNDLARTNFATLSGATYEAAVVSQGFSFNGTNAGVSAAGDNALNLATTNDNVTIEAWVRPLANTNTYGVMSVVGKRYSPNDITATGYELYLSDGTPGFQIASVAGVASFATTNDIRGGYHHLAVTLDRSSTNGGHIYVDGIAKLDFNPTVVSGSLSNSAPVRIGVHPQPGFNGWYKGVIDEVTIYRRALSNTEITALYAAGSAGKCKVDTDGDGLTDLQEAFLGTNSNLADTDGDGLTDGDEVFVYRTNPKNQDSDGDGVIDQAFRIYVTRPANGSLLP